MKQKIRLFKGKKFASKEIVICLSCGSDKINRSQFTQHCQSCGFLNFYEWI